MRRKLNNLAGWPLVIVAVFGVALYAKAQQTGDEEGQNIRIGPDGAVTSSDTGAQTTQPASPYWVGLLGGQVTPELRAHLPIGESEGVLVLQVVADSPAADAGIKQYDVIVRANDTQLNDMSQLVDLVRESGDQDKSLALEVLRKGERQSIEVTPAERPADQTMMLPEGGELPPQVQDWLRRMNPRGGENFAFRAPGMMQGQRLGAMPGNVSVTIEKQGDSTHATIKRGDQSWTVNSDDPKSLDQLPEDLRPFVENLMSGNGGAFGFDFGTLPSLDRGFRNTRFQEQLEQMQQEIEDLRDRMLQRGADSHEVPMTDSESAE